MQWWRILRRLTDLYLAGSGNGGNEHQYKIRVLLLVGHRHELIAMAEDRGSVLWPQWNQTVVQLKKRDIQSHRIKPHYAVVIAPVQDVSHEPIVLALPKVPQTVRRVHIRGRHVRTHGATRGCEGCMAAMTGKKVRHHTEPCRNRFTQVLENTPRGRGRARKPAILCAHDFSLITYVITQKRSGYSQQ